MRWLVAAIAFVILVGCQSGTYPDPNDPADVGPLPVATLRRNLKSVSDRLNDRQGKGEIDEDQYRTYIKRAAEELLEGSTPAEIPPDEAWQYAEIFIAAQKWQDAKAALQTAVAHAKQAKDNDRYVNDVLRLARAEAELGEVPAAIATARSVLTTQPDASAPVLPAVLLEIVPAARRKGHDTELAKLLEDAIQAHMRTIVDPKSEAGKAFFYARPFHIRKAWQTIITLYIASKRPDLSKQAAQKGDRMLASMGSA
jgi:hypothetical protein